MNKETLKALENSIEHWRRMMDGEGRDGECPSAQGCDLCAMFNPNGEEKCEGCPVMEHTGRPICDDTPYYDALNAFNAQHDGDAFLGHAKREYDFLCTLLPKKDNE